MPVLHVRMLRSTTAAALGAVDRALARTTSELQRIHREAHEIEAMCADLDDPNRDEYRCLTERQTVVRKALGEFDE